MLKLILSSDAQPGPWEAKVKVRSWCFALCRNRWGGRESACSPARLRASGCRELAAEPPASGRRSYVSCSFQGKHPRQRGTLELFCAFRSGGAVQGFSGSTARHAPVQRVGPASVMECVWTGRTGPECVGVTKASTGPPVKPARAANTESTVTKVQYVSLVTSSVIFILTFIITCCLLRVRMQERTV